MRLPGKKRPGNPILASDWNLLIDAIEARTPRPGTGVELVSSSGGFTYRVRKTAASGSSSDDCPFGEILTYKDGDTTKTGIRGGVVYAGEKVWNVDPKALTLTVTGTFKIFLEVGVTANVEDGVLLPGIKTSTAPEWKQVAGDGNYPNQTIPTAPTGNGKAIIAAGILTIEDGSATFAKAGCGTIRIDHCPGTLTHTRL
jgi:hypothetical protein